MGVIQTYLSYALALLLAISIGINVIYHFNKAVLKAENATLNITVGQLKQDIADKSKTVSDQNLKIIDAAKTANINKAQIDDLTAKLATQTQKNTDLIQKLLNQPAPKTCDDAISYLKNNIGIYQW